MAMKKRILQGVKLFLEQYSINDLTMDLLAEFIGISKKTIYNHFNSKHDLLTEFKLQFIEESTRKAMIIVEDKKLSFTSKIDELLNIAHHSIAQEKAFQGQALSTKTGLLNVGLSHKIQRVILEIINGIVKEAQKRGILKENINVETLTYILLNIVEGSITSSSSILPAMPPSDILRNSINYLFSGILNEQGVQELQYMQIPS